MPVIAYYEFNDTDTIAGDQALDNGAQDGSYRDGAYADGGRAILDGQDDKVKFGEFEAYQLSRGTVEIQFAAAELKDQPQTVLSRDSVGETAGGFRIEVLGDGSVLISHETATGTTTYSTGPGFMAAGDEINVSYGFDEAAGGRLVIGNLTQGSSFAADTPAGLTMDMGDINQKWMIGVGQSLSDPWMLNNLDKPFEGSVEYFKILDETVPPDDRDGIVYGRPGDSDDLIDVGYTGDNDGDFIDNDDALLPGAAPNDDYVIARDGDDTVIAGVGDDIVFGGEGNDSVFGEAGVDTLRGGIGNDTLFGGEGDDEAYGSAGADLIYGNEGDDSLRGGNGADNIYAGEGDDTAYGGRGHDALDGNDGDDYLDGGRGQDSIGAGRGSDTVLGGRGDDLIRTTDPGLTDAELPDIAFPGLYDADAAPDDDRDSVHGGYGDDTIATGDDDDTIFGGHGFDRIDAGVDDDAVEAGYGNDTVTAGEGNDTVEGRQGADLIVGGSGDDADETALPDDIDPVPGNDRDSLLGGRGADTILGGDDDDTIYGGTGNDLLDGGIDEDSILAGLGNDTIIGGEGADYMFGSADRDRFVVDSRTAGIGDTIDGGGGGDDFDRLDLRGSGPFRITYTSTDREDGFVDFLDDDGNVTGRLEFTEIENVIPCFTPGTMIATPRGEVPVETLRVGDKVITRDNGIEEVRWLGARHLEWAELSANPHLQPVLIRQGSLGNGLPEQDMLVSPNHRMLVANDRTALYFAEHEVLVAAKHLVGTGGVHAVTSMGTTYIHFMFDRHEVVLANGAWTESFQPGDQTLKGMGNAQRAEIFELFPELREAQGLADYTAARRTLKRHEAKLLAFR
jgi:Ca2+-binding RTX toxin-like protein